jgi:hypothetical protein
MWGVGGTGWPGMSGCTARLEIAAADADASVTQFLEPAGPPDSNEND